MDNTISVPDVYLHRSRKQGEFALNNFRSQFERDRDRIIYSIAFRRLSGKTQIFLSTQNDNLRTRLTHTLEVSQISRIIARNLGLDEMLCEAIALGHDIGHTPFGHVGERTLSLIMNGCDEIAEFQQRLSTNDMGFKHNLQSVRIACDLAKLYGYRGYNLSNYTLWGIINHTSLQYKPCGFNTGDICYFKRYKKECRKGHELSVDFYNKYFKYIKIQLPNKKVDAWSFEGYTVALSDEIAQLHHDIEDGVMRNIIKHEELINKINTYLHPFFDDEDKKLFLIMKKINDERHFLSIFSKFIIGFFTKRVIESSSANIQCFKKELDIKERKDFINLYPDIENTIYENIIAFPSGIAYVSKEEPGAFNELKSFLKNRILNSFEAQRMDGKGRYIIRSLVKAYLSNPRQLHDLTIKYVHDFYNGRTNIYWQDPSPEIIGNMRNDIDTAGNKSDDHFQICLLRVICDHIAAMTDRFALQEYEKLYGR